MSAWFRFTAFVIPLVVLVIHSESASAQDCNSNGHADSNDLAAGTSVDCDSNGTPDECDLAVPLHNKQKLFADHGWIGDHFGVSVSISGDILVVGASYADEPGADSGEAYVYRRNGATWVYEAQLLPSDGAAGDHFGDAVAAGPGFVVVGSPDDDDAGNGSGSAYIFRYREFPSSGWYQYAKLTAPDAAAFDHFGNAVAASSDRVLVGARADGVPTFEAGSAHVFRLTGDEWVHEAKLLASAPGSGDDFGWSVAIDGDTALIGAIDDNDGANGGGVAHFFRHTPSGWVFEDKVFPADIAAFDGFGYSVSLCGDRAIIGSPGDDDNGNLSGSAYVFTRSGSTWSQQAKITPTDASINARFGSAVAISGNWAVFGAPFSSVAAFNAGAAYVFGHDQGGWSQRARMLPDEPDDTGLYAFAVSIDGRNLAVGVYGGPGTGIGGGETLCWQVATDCNTNGVMDECEIAAGSAMDCNANCAIDACELADGCSQDSNGNLVPDECDPDCNGNGVVDAIDIAGATSIDCDSNGVPDECEPDCNTNGIADGCDVLAGTSSDCNLNTSPDDCESSLDCNANATPDICELAAGSATDCNQNGVLDSCDLIGGTSVDNDTNGLPDLCDRTLTGYWRFDFAGDTGCQILDSYLSEVRYLRFDEDNSATESWIENAGQYLKLNYPSTDGPSYNLYNYLGLQTDNTDRAFNFNSFDTVSGMVRIRELVSLNDGSQGEGEQDTPEDGGGRIDGVMDASGQQIQGTYSFLGIEGLLWCGTFSATRLPGTPPELPVVIDVAAVDASMSSTSLTRPGSLDVLQRSYRIRTSFAGNAITVRYLLSTDVIPDGHDVELGSEIVGTPAATMLGLHSGPGPELTVPACVPSGDNHFVLVVFDADEAVAETDESNNVIAIPVTVSPVPLSLDYDGDCDEDVDDAAILIGCLAGPGALAPPAGCTGGQFEAVMQDFDDDVDLSDFALIQALLP